jgi:hypothetical protein
VEVIVHMRREESGKEERDKREKRKVRRGLFVVNTCTDSF